MVQHGMKRVSRLAAQKLVSVVRLDSGIHQRTSAGHQPRAPIAEISHDLFEAIHGIRDLLRARQTRAYRQLPRIVEGFRSQLLLALEMPVDAAFLQASGLHQVRHGRALKSLLIEEWGRLANDFLPCLLALAHGGLPPASAGRTTRLCDQTVSSGTIT